MAARRAAEPTSSASWIGEIEDVGYVVVPSLLGLEAVDELRAAFPSPTPGATLHVEIGDDTPHVDRWRSLAGSPGVGSLLAQALGGDVEVRVHGRDPGLGAGAQGLHADRPPGRAHRFDALTLLWMLDEVTPDNGATSVVPRSHRGAAAVPRHLAQPEEAHPDEVVIVGRPGDVVIFDAHLWHGGRCNASGERRRVVQMTASRRDVAGSTPSLIVASS